MNRRSRQTLVVVVVASLLAALAHAAPPSDRGNGGAGNRKVSFELLAFPDVTFVDSVRRLDACLVNHGDADADLVNDGASATDHVEIRIPVGTDDGALTPTAGSMTCFSLDPAWSCSGPVVDAGDLAFTVAPIGAVTVAADSATCFRIELIDVSPDVGLAFVSMRQRIDASRATPPLNAFSGVFKTDLPPLRHDDLEDVHESQHHVWPVPFSALSGSATDAQVPDDITVLRAAVAGDLDCLGCVTSARVADGTIALADMAAASVSSAAIVNGAVQQADLAAGAVTSAAIADGTVAAADLAASSVTGAAIVDGTVTDADLSIGAIGSSAIADGSIRDADVSPLANIAGTKISPDFGDQHVRTSTATRSVDVGPGGIVLSGPNGTTVVSAGGTTAFAGDNNAGIHLLANDGRIELQRPDGTRPVVIDADEAGIGTITTQVIEITGGADVAEPFEIRGGDAAPGAVVCIDPDAAGGLRVCDRPADQTVAGVVSGAGGVRPGLVLRQVGAPLATGSRAVTLAGRAWVLADATSSPIQPGNLLTTSATAGHAMAVSDPRSAHGAILGKAMTSLPEGTGLVLVLVNLH